MSRKNNYCTTGSVSSSPDHISRCCAPVRRGQQNVKHWHTFCGLSSTSTPNSGHYKSSHKNVRHHFINWNDCVSHFQNSNIGLYRPDTSIHIQIITIHVNKQRLAYMTPPWPPSNPDSFHPGLHIFFCCSLFNDMKTVFTSTWTYFQSYKSL